MNDITEIVGRLRKLDADAAAISAAISDRSMRGHTANGQVWPARPTRRVCALDRLSSNHTTYTKGKVENA